MSPQTHMSTRAHMPIFISPPPHQEVAKLRKEVLISKAALEASQAAAKKADADLSAAKAAADDAAAGKTAADKVRCSSCSPYRSRVRWSLVCA